MTTPGSVFDWLAEALERNSLMTRLEARGAIRVAVRRAGLDVTVLTAGQVAQLLDGALAKGLDEQGIRYGGELSDRIQREFAASPFAAQAAAEPAAASIAPDPGPAEPAGATPLVPRGPAGPPTLFDWLAEMLTQQTSLSLLQARGTVRVALKEAGLAPEQVTKRQMRVVVQELVPKHLRACGIADPESICRRVLGALAAAAVVEPSGTDSPEDVFGRFGRS